MPNVLVTGATGSLGGLVAANLLSRGWRVGCLVRGRAGEPAALRLARLGLVGAVPIEAEIGGRLDALAGARWDVVVHCASDRTPTHERASHRLNVDGPTEVLVAARAPRFVHVSTTRVAGARTGLALESEVDVGQAFTSSTDASLLQGELKLRNEARTLGVDLRVVRPGWVIGRGDPLTALAALLSDLAWRSKSARSQLRIAGIKSAKMQLAPRGWVASCIAAIAQAESAGAGTFHLASHCPTQDALFSLLAERTGFPGLRVYTPRGSNPRTLSRTEARAHALLGGMADHLARPLEFDDSEARRFLEPLGLATPHTAGNPLRSLVDSLLQR